MASVNKAMLIGRVGKEPEVRRTQDGKAIATISLATSEKWKEKATGEQVEKTEWHRVVVFGGLADVVDKYVNKGDMLYFEGKIQTRKWTDKEGIERYSTEIVVSGVDGTMQMLGGNRNNTAEPSNVPASENQKPAEPFDDNIPF